MKKVLLFLVVPFAALAIELHPEQECETLKNILITDLTQYYDLSVNIAEDATRIKTYANTLQNRNDFMVGGSDYALIQSINNASDEAIRHSIAVSNQTSYLLGVVSNVVCSACPVDEGGDSSCCDDVIALLQSIEQDTASILSLLDDTVFLLEQMNDDIAEIWALLYRGLNDITNTLNYADFLLEHGFESTTNILLGISTNLFPVSSPTYTSDIGRALYLKFSNNGLYSYGVQTVTPSRPNVSTLGYLGAILREQFYSRVYIAGLNNYHFNLREVTFPMITNTLVATYSEQTNYFSFFRGEIGVQGVLSDWQSEQVSGSYHDFLTNHYIAVVTGGPLSGNQSTKTNWFSRIETLLAALVFTDSAETNTVDTSAGNEERQQLATSYETANQAAASFSEDFKTTSQDIVSLYRSYFNTFDTAAMPSHVVLMRLSSNGSEDVEISFQSDSLGILVESCRVVTTLCWSSVGIFLLYKFLVWSARCVIVACQFIYRAISSVFKS